MRRLIRGLVLAGTAMGAFGCADNPIGDGADKPALLVASPSEVFADAGEAVSIVAELQDDRGAALETQFAVLNVDAGISAVIDESLNPYYDKDGNLVPPTSPTRVRIRVTAGTEAGVYGFEVSAGGFTEKVTVRVVPAEVTGAFSSPTPACNAEVVYMVGAPYSFLPTAHVHISPVVNPSVSPDGRRFSFITHPGFSGRVTFHDMQLDFAPGVPLAFETAESVNVGTNCFAGQEEFSTAPTVPMPIANGEETSWFDVGNLAVDQFYGFTVPTDGTYELVLDWDNSADVDLILYTATGVLFNTSMVTGSHPEFGVMFLPAGDYVIRVNLYSGLAPAWIGVRTSRWAN